VSSKACVAASTAAEHEQHTNEGRHRRSELRRPKLLSRTSLYSLQQCVYVRARNNFITSQFKWLASEFFNPCIGSDELETVKSSEAGTEQRQDVTLRIYSILGTCCINTHKLSVLIDHSEGHCMF
jgi:hypothetical protein